MKRYIRFAFSFQGVLSRAEFLCVILFNYFISFVVTVAVMISIGIVFSPSEQFQRILFFILMLVMYVFLIGPAVRRLRDIGATGWWILGLIVPYLNVVVLISLLFRPAWNQVQGLRHLFAMLKILAESDGRVNQEEADFFAYFCAENLPDENIFKIAVKHFIRGAANPFLSFEYHLKKYLEKGQPSMRDRTYVMGLMLRLAEIDGDVNQREDALLGKVHAVFGLAEELPEGFDDLISMLAKLAKADGIVSKSEITVIENWFTHTLGFSNTQRQKAAQIFNTAKTTIYSFEQHARNFYGLYQGEDQLLQNVMGLLTELAFADNNVSKEESDMIESAAAIFGFEKRGSDSWKSSTASASDSYQDNALTYARILGIGLDAGMDEIKARYRKLMAANHPDKVASMSDAIKNAAEIETKKINKAYEYFKARYA